ncbi:MAG: hypothetical protein CMD43_01675 [Gammaproteobacteria bacterium]|nr:hypothetical protein [Gammaproteobacteria bacterium]|tara:strand:+ start:1686 stop:2240 length:555 start_codon:yes stop_codon:yes gene_type:complete
MKFFNTADLCDEFDNIQIAKPIFSQYGRKKKFCGKMRTVSVLDDNSYVKKLIEKKVNGDVMVIDGNASDNCALLGDNLARKAFNNGWSGFIINGYIRDVEIINDIEIGIKAIGSLPRKSEKKDIGKYGEILRFAEVDFTDGHYVYSDSDGIIVSKDILDKKDDNTTKQSIPYIKLTGVKKYDDT